MSRASEDLLDQLHALQAESLLDALKTMKDSGEVNAPLLAQVNKFLKDNGVDRAVLPGDPTDLLEEELPEFDDDGKVLNFGRS